MVWLGLLGAIAIVALDAMVLSSPKAMKAVRLPFEGEQAKLPLIGLVLPTAACQFVEFLAHSASGLLVADHEGGVWIFPCRDTKCYVTKRHSLLKLKLPDHLLRDYKDLGKLSSVIQLCFTVMMLFATAMAFSPYDIYWETVSSCHVEFTPSSSIPPSYPWYNVRAVDSQGGNSVVGSNDIKPGFKFETAATIVITITTFLGKNSFSLHILLYLFHITYSL
jgi:hypothetical protein